MFSAEARELWQQLRQKELKEAAEREQAGATGRFYSRGELNRSPLPCWPVTEVNKGRRMTYWCWHCTKFTTPTTEGASAMVAPAKDQHRLQLGLNVPKKL